MAFSGSLDVISLRDIVQLIGLGQKSGTLTITTGRGRFSVFFRGGRVVDAAATRFEQRPATAGAPWRKELYVRANLSGDPARGVGLREMTGKILGQSAGYFNFMPGDPVTDSGPGLDVSAVLSEPSRPPGDGPAEPPDTMRYLYGVLKLLPDVPGGEDFLGLILDAARRVFDRAIVFGVGEHELEGLSGYSVGYTGAPEYLEAALASVRIPGGFGSPLHDAVEAKHISIGLAHVEWWRGNIPPEFGPPPEMEYVALPVVSGDKCLMVIFGDTYAHREFEDDLRALEILCQHIGLKAENARLRGRGMRG